MTTPESKRVCERPEPGDGPRILTDRMRPSPLTFANGSVMTGKIEEFATKYRT
ncbi:hypothetical protein [Rothia uropygialis]|uniref:hypothetical protein n=1 Tax=Kocuria sp. 36 TaxID=1415402 RepID=UPI0013EAF26D|nr:hypothetical protein [Kocuria sp. 36]